MFILYSCLGLLSRIELCIYLCCLVLFVSMLAKWLAVKTFSWYLLCRRVSLQRQDWRVIYCNGLLYVFPTRNSVNFLSNFAVLTNIQFEGTIQPICAESAVEPPIYQSVWKTWISWGIRRRSPKNTGEGTVGEKSLDLSYQGKFLLFQELLMRLLLFISERIAVTYVVHGTKSCLFPRFDAKVWPAKSGN